MDQQGITTPFAAGILILAMLGVLVAFGFFFKGNVHF